MKQYIINEDDLRNLIKNSCMYKALEQGGVDNWIGYDISKQDYLQGLEWGDVIAIYMRNFTEYKED